MKYRLSVMYKGGAGMSTSRDTMVDVMMRLANIALLADQGNVVIERIEIASVNEIVADLPPLPRRVPQEPLSRRQN